MFVIMAFPGHTHLPCFLRVSIVSVLMLYIPVNNVSVILGQFPVFLG